MPSEASAVNKAAVGIIKDYLGDTTAKMYADYYLTQSDDLIVKSISALLSEYVGEARAKEILDKSSLLKMNRI